MASNTASNERINLRLSDSAKQLITRAASFEGKTVSNFILSSALASAEKTLHEHETVALGRQDAERFLAALDGPISFNETLSEALADHDRHVDSR